MSVVPVKPIEEALTSTDETETIATLSWCWADIENLLGAEWEIGASCMPGDATLDLVWANKKTSEET
jgi:hypothetical protein